MISPGISHASQYLVPSLHRINMCLLRRGICESIFS